MQLTASITDPCLYLGQVSCASNPLPTPTRPVPVVRQGFLGFCWQVLLSLVVLPLTPHQEAGWKYPEAGVSGSILLCGTEIDD